MVVVFVVVGWLTLVSHQSLPFLCEQSDNKVDNEFFSQYSTKLKKVLSVL
jgi:hypothetical protein